MSAAREGQQKPVPTHPPVLTPTHIPPIITRPLLFTVSNMNSLLSNDSCPSSVPYCDGPPFLPNVCTCRTFPRCIPVTGTLDITTLKRLSQGIVLVGLSVSNIINSLIYGVRIQHVGLRSPIQAANHPSAIAHCREISDNIQKEVKLCRIARIPLPLAKYTLQSPLGAVPKKGSSKYRTIHNLSFPKGKAINDAVIARPAKSYQGIDDATSLIRQFRAGCFLAKLDIKDAYRLIPIHPHDRELLGFNWRGDAYVDLRLPFGLRNSPPVFEEVATLCETILRNKFGVRSFIRYVDDFLFTGYTAKQCAEAIQAACKVFEEIRMPVNLDKLRSEGVPKQSCIFLGLELDASRFEIRLSRDRIVEILALLQTWKSMSSCTKKSLQSLVGKLMFAARAVRAARTFTQRCVLALRAFRDATSTSAIPIPEDMRSDLAWWESFLPLWNGISIMLPDHSFQHVLGSDASNLGFGGWFQSKWVSQPWPEHVLKIAYRSARISMPFLELFAITSLVLTFAPLLRGNRVRVCSDSEVAVLSIRAGFSKDLSMLALIRELLLTCAQHSFIVLPHFIPGLSNDSADALSRLQIRRFRELMPLADPSPTSPVLPSMKL